MGHSGSELFYDRATCQIMVFGCRSRGSRYGCAAGGAEVISRTNGALTLRTGCHGASQNGKPKTVLA